jgi:hypothetical protein
MSQYQSERLNKVQNDPNFVLDIKEMPLIFQKKLVEKVLDDIQEDPFMPRTVTIKCLYKHCK